MPQVHEKPSLTQAPWLDARVLATGDRRRIALAFAAAGVPVIPLGGKEPHVKSFTEPPHLERVATIDPARIRRWWEKWPNANPGTVCGPVAGFVVLDLDPRNYTAASPALLAELLPQLPPTFTVITGRGDGGRHLYFAHPGLPVQFTTDLAPGVQLLGDRHPVVLPGAIHPDTGGRYALQDARPPAACPAVLLAHGTRRAVDRPRPRSPLKASTRVSSPPTTLPGVIGAGARHETCKREILRLRGIGYDAEQLRAKMLDVFNRCAQPPGDRFEWDDVEALIAWAATTLPTHAPPGLRARLEPIARTLPNRTDRRVLLDGVVPLFALAKKTTGQDAAPLAVRSVGLLARVKGKTTAAKSLQRLVRAGVLVPTYRHQKGSKLASVYRLCCLKGTRLLREDGGDLPATVSPSGNAGVRDLFTRRRGALGDLAGEIWCRLGTAPVPASTLATAVGARRDSAWKRLQALAAQKLAIKRGNGWCRGPADPAAVAEQLGLVARRQKQREQVQHERAAYAAWRAQPSSRRVRLVPLVAEIVRPKPATMVFATAGPLLIEARA